MSDTDAYKEALHLINANYKKDIEAAKQEHEKFKKENPIRAFFSVGNDAYFKKIEALETNVKEELGLLNTATKGFKEAAHVINNLAQEEIKARPDDKIAIVNTEIKVLTDLNNIQGSLQLTHDSNGKPAILVHNPDGKEQIYRLGVADLHAEAVNSTDLKSPSHASSPKHVEKSSKPEL